MLFETEPVYTFGRRIRPQDILTSTEDLLAAGAEVLTTDRGGNVTFHGPGQLVCFPVLDIKRRRLGARDYVCRLEEVMLTALTHFGLEGERSEGRPGVWLNGEKIGSVGVRVRSGISGHGFALNVSPDLRWFARIRPCGLADVSMTSIARHLSATPRLELAAEAVVDAFQDVFTASLLRDRYATGFSAETAHA